MLWQNQVVVKKQEDRGTDNKGMGSIGCIIARPDIIYSYRKKKERFPGIIVIAC
jgi:hypothetical protein